MTLNQIEVTETADIPFDYLDKTPGGQNLGRAEFAVCIKYLRGKVSEYFVYPLQQRLFHFWHFSGGDIDFAISSYGGLPSANIWRVGWCKEHRSQTLEIYVPNYSGILRLERRGIAFLPPKSEA